MIQLLDLALRPMMRSWGRSAFRSLAGVPRPTDDPRVHASGVNSDRILLFGSGAAVGWGVLSHDMALPGSLARALSTLTGRGTDVDVIADPDFRADSAIRDLLAVNLTRYDGIVVTLGLNEAVGFASISAWRRNLDALLDYLTSTAFEQTPIFLLGIHSMTQITRLDGVVLPFISHHSRALNRVSAQLSAHRQRVTFVPFEPAPRTQKNRYRSTNEYRDGGMYLASRMAPVLNAQVVSAGARGRPRSGGLDSLARRNAIEQLSILDAARDERFDRLTEFARRSFHTSAAKVTIVGSNRFWTISSRGVVPTEGSRDDSICFTAIESEDSLVVGDASHDPRFAQMRHVQGPPPVRFYAGHRIEAPSGVPIGVLCVQDSEPRDSAGVDRALLRDIALLVQKEVWLGSRDAGFAQPENRRVAAVPIQRTFAPATSSQ